MIFLAGIHGVGKDAFSKEIEEKTGIKSYSASELIQEQGNISLNPNKRANNISKNQDYLVEAIRNKNLSERYILNGHFCLINSNGEVERIPIDTFFSLKLEKIVLLIERPEIIIARREIRDKIVTSVEETKSFQDEEIAYGREVARLLDILIGIFNSTNERKKAIDFVVKERSEKEKDIV